MYKEFLVHITVNVNSRKHLSEELLVAATRAFEENLAEQMIQDDIADSVEAECTLWEEI